jgi:uncharacterized protein YjbI with pentapeptide repeats
MQAALDIAAYALGVTLIVGVLLLGVLAYDLWYGTRFRTPHPDYVRLPSKALEAVREVYARMKAAYSAASARERRLLEVHVRRMEERVQMLEAKVFDEQAPYYKMVARREKIWRGAKALYDQVRQMPRGTRKRAKHLLDEASNAYRIANEGVKEEWDRGVLRDNLMVEEVRSVGVLDATYLPKLLEQIRAHAAKSAPEAEGSEWKEPGVEETAEGDAKVSPAALPERHGPDHAQLEPAEQVKPAAVPKERLAAATYDRIREALAPLFGRKSGPPALKPIEVEAPTIPTGAWKPAPAPPRIEVAPPIMPRADIAKVSPALTPTVPAAPGLLRQQDLLGSGLAGAGRRYADSSFAVATLPRGILRDADLSRSGFAGVRFVGRHRYLDCRFAEADLSGIQLEAQTRAHQFVHCNFKNARFDASRLSFALFHECDLSGSRWTGAHLERVRFSECMLQDVEWGGAEFVETRILSMKTPTTAREPGKIGDVQSPQAQPASVEASVPAAGGLSIVNGDPAPAKTSSAAPGDVQPANPNAPPATPR